MEELAGKGVTAEVKGHKVAAGNKKLMADKTDFEGQLKEHSGGTQVYVAVDGKYAGCILLADKIKEDAYKAVAALKREGIQTVMLTGDSRRSRGSCSGTPGYRQGSRGPDAFR